LFDAAAVSAQPEPKQEEIRIHDMPRLVVDRLTPSAHFTASGQPLDITFVVRNEHPTEPAGEVGVLLRANKETVGTKTVYTSRGYR
jgi:hypothetical protein